MDGHGVPTVASVGPSPSSPRGVRGPGVSARPREEGYLRSFACLSTFLCWCFDIAELSLWKPPASFLSRSTSSTSSTSVMSAVVLAPDRALRVFWRRPPAPSVPEDRSIYRDTERFPYGKLEKEPLPGLSILKRWGTGRKQRGVRENRMVQVRPRPGRDETETETGIKDVGEGSSGAGRAGEETHRF